MYSNRSEYSHSRQHSDRSSRQWDGYDDKWERREPHRDIQRDSHHKYGGDGHGSTERTSRGREYSNSPKRLYSKDPLNRDRSRRSPVRRRMSSSDRGTSEKKRQRFTEGCEDQYSYRRVSEDKASRRSPDSFSRTRVTTDFKHTLPQEEAVSYRKPSQDSRHRYRQEEFSFRQQHDDSTGRRSSGYYKDRDGDERSWDRSPERTRSQDCSTKGYVKTRARNDSPYMDREDHCQDRTRFTLNASSGQSFESDVPHDSAAVPEQKSSTKGFQRFLDVLNKGVNFDTLTKIVTQTSTKVDPEPLSPVPFINTADRPWSPNCAGRQQGGHQNTRHWSEHEGSQTLPPHKSFSPLGSCLSAEKSLQRGDGERSYISSKNRSRSPSVVEKIPLTPEEEHKHKQMQDVLQAIGMNLGSEELGQMSHRIQERLYGKKDVDGGRHRRGSRERDVRQAFSPRMQNRSSSSRSSFSPPTQECYMKKDSISAQRDVPEVHLHRHQLVDYGQNSSSNNLRETDACEANSLKSTAVCQTFSQNPTYPLSEPPLTPVMPMYSPVSCSPLPYPALPPNLPPTGPGLFLPRLPPFFPYPRVPALNILPAVLAQTQQMFPPYIGNPQPVLNLPLQPLNNMQKSKTLSRPRCLQVIETKQPG